jgi:hypothetical protein
MIHINEQLKMIKTIREHLDNVNVEDAKTELRILETYVKGVFLGYQQGLQTMKEE